MKKNKTLLLLLFLTVTLISSCFWRATEESFANDLQAADTFISTNSEKRALKKLSHLSRYAQTPANYLSVAKRQVSLNGDMFAIKTLQKGLKKNPADAELSAYLVYILLNEGRYLDTKSYYEFLENSQFASIAAEASLTADIFSDLNETSASLLSAAYADTRKQIFLEKEALVYAKEGKILQAALLRKKIPQKAIPLSPYFWTALSYDIGDFDTVFADLQYTRDYADDADIQELTPEPFDDVRRHILLAADAAYGLNDIERARAFWQESVDRFPSESYDIFYNLAMTAPTFKERIDTLLECISRDPFYYPAIACYTREYVAHRQKAPAGDAVEVLLEEKGFYSLEMERLYFASPKMTVLPDVLLKTAMENPNADTRFILEEFKYNLAIHKVPERAKGFMWNLLEQYPERDLIRSYARWFFAYDRDFNAAVSIAPTENVSENAFYKGVECALRGESNEAVRFFTDSLVNTHCTLAATVNIAYIYDAAGEPGLAIKEFIGASGMEDDPLLKSKFQYEAARILADNKAPDRAIPLLTSALELDSSNYIAEVLLRRLQAAQ